MISAQDKIKCLFLKTQGNSGRIWVALLLVFGIFLWGWVITLGYLYYDDLQQEFLKAESLLESQRKDLSESIYTLGRH